jgi:hypothetical protein
MVQEKKRGGYVLRGIVGMRLFILERAEAEVVLFAPTKHPEQKYDY